MESKRIPQTSDYNKKEADSLVIITKKKQTHRYRKQTSGYQWGQGRREGQYRGRGVQGTNYHV